MLQIGSKPTRDAFFGQGTGDIILDNVQCTGNEQRLIECTSSADLNCDHSEDAGVQCEGTLGYTLGYILSNVYK